MCGPKSVHLPRAAASIMSEPPIGTRLRPTKMTVGQRVELPQVAHGVAEDHGLAVVGGPRGRAFEPAVADHRETRLLDQLGDLVESLGLARHDGQAKVARSGVLQERLVDVEDDLLLVVARAAGDPEPRAAEINCSARASAPSTRSATWAVSYFSEPVTITLGGAAQFAEPLGISCVWARTRSILPKKIRVSRLILRYREKLLSLIRPLTTTTGMRRSWAVKMKLGQTSSSMSRQMDGPKTVERPPHDPREVQREIEDRATCGRRACRPGHSRCRSSC